MGDELSKELFCKRFLYNLTLEEKYLNKMICETLNFCKKNEKKVFPFIEKIKRNGGKVFLYGAGSGGLLVKKYLDALKLDIVAYCDADTTKQGSFYLQKPVISPEDMMTEKWGGREAYILICVYNPYVQKQVYNKLIDLGFYNDRILVAVDYFGKQLFLCRVLMMEYL